MQESSFLTNCAINECDGDGRTVGRCWFPLKDNQCPRHGDVAEVQSTYALTGKLVKETLHHSWNRIPANRERK